MRRRGVKGYHRVRVTCRDLIDRPRTYVAGLAEEERRDGFICARCGETVPHAGNEIHDVSVVGKSEDA